MLSSSGSVTCWIKDLKEGDREATRKLWERYFQQLLEFTRKKFKNFPQRMADEEDVVLHVFENFFREAENGRLPNLNDRESLWALLIVKTSQKALDYIRLEKAVKRQPVEPMPRWDPTPDEVAELTDQWERLLGSLGDDAQGRILQQIVIWKMEGYTNAQIAADMDVTERTVERKLERIRKIWEEQFGDELGR